MQQKLAELKQHGKHIVVISNSGKRASVNAARIAKFGYGEDLIDDVYTSGELARLRLHDLTSSHTEDRPLRVYYFGNDDDRSALNGLPIIEIENPAVADLIIIGGMGAQSRTEEDYRLFLHDAASADVPAYCTNPDLLSFYYDVVCKTGLAGLLRSIRKLAATVLILVNRIRKYIITY